MDYEIWKDFVNWLHGTDKVVSVFSDLGICMTHDKLIDERSVSIEAVEINHRCEINVQDQMCVAHFVRDGWAWLLGPSVPVDMCRFS